LSQTRHELTEVRAGQSLVADGSADTNRLPASPDKLKTQRATKTGHYATHDLAKQSDARLRDLKHASRAVAPQKDFSGKVKIKVNTWLEITLTEGKVSPLVRLCLHVLNSGAAESRDPPGDGPVSAVCQSSRSRKIRAMATGRYSQRFGAEGGHSTRNCSRRR
jgi:hypothetical protein